MFSSKLFNLYFFRYINFVFLTIAFFLVLSQNVKGAPLSEVQARGHLIIGVKDNLRPLGYKDNHGNLQGFEIDIARRLAEELFGDSKAVQFIPILNQNRLQVIIEDTVDLVIASVSINASRQRMVDFSDYYFISGTAIVVKKSASNINLQNSETKIGVLEYSRAIDEVKYNLPKVQLTAVNSYQQALTLMEKNEIQGFAGDITVLKGWIQENPEYELLSHFWGGYPLAIVLSKGRQYQSLRDKVSQAIRKLKQEGWLEERAKYWGLTTINNKTKTKLDYKNINQIKN